MSVMATKAGPALVLAADIGGTHAGFMIGERQAGGCQVLF